MKNKKNKSYKYTNTIKILLAILGIITAILTVLTLIIVDNKINSEKPYNIKIYEIDGNKITQISEKTEKNKPNYEVDHTKYDLEGYEQILNEDYKKEAIKRISPKGDTIFRLYFKKKSFDVIFKNYSNSDLDSKTVRYKGKINLKDIKTPKRENYVFKYWSLMENGKEFDFDREEFVKDTVLYPVFEREEVEYKKIFFLQNIDNDEYTKEEITEKGYAGDKKNIDLSSKPGFEYVTNTEEKLETVLTSGQENKLVCYLNRKKFRINFDLDGGRAIVNENELRSQLVRYEGKIKKPEGVTIEKKNSNFEYWVGYNSEIIDFETFRVTTDLALRAHYNIYRTSCKIEPYFENIEGTDFVLDPSKITIKDVEIGTTYNFVESDITGTDGFKFDQDNINNVLSASVENENEEYTIKVYYTRKKYNVTVKYLKPDGEKVFDLEEEVKEGKYEEELTLEPKISTKGYKYTGENKKYTITSSSSQEVRFVYEIDRDQTFEAVINYYIEGTTDPVPDIDGKFGIESSKKTVSGYVTQEIDIDFPDFSGINEYALVEGQPTKIKISEKEKVEINIYYKDTSREVDTVFNLGTKSDTPKLKYFKKMPKRLLEDYIANNVDDTVAKPIYREYDGIGYDFEGSEYFIKSTEDIILPDSATNIKIYWRTPKDYYYDFDATNGSAGAKLNKFRNIEAGTTIIPSRTAWADIIPVGLYSDVLKDVEVKVFINDNVRQIYDRAFYNCKKIIGKITLNENINKIGSQAFASCESVTEISSESGILRIENINDSAFEDMKLLKKIGELSNILSIGRATFRGCSNLENIKINNNIQKIYDEVFKDCSKLKIDSELNLLNVSLLGKSVFENCEKLETEVKFGNNLETIEEKTFKNSGIKGSLDLSNIKEVKRSAFEGCKNLDGSITFGEGLERIQAKAFEGDSKIIGEIIFPSTLKFIEEYAFFQCKSITKLKFNEGIKTIGEQAFSHLFELIGESDEGNLTLPASIYKIDRTAFVNCKNLKGTIKFPANLSFNTIEVQTFQGCEKITKVEIPENVKKIGARAFMDCRELNGTIDLTNIVEINEEVFKECRKVTKFILSDNLRFIKKHAFYNCSSWTQDGLDLSGMTFIDRINEGAFYGCLNLTGTLKLPGYYNFKKIERQVFALCGFKEVDFNNKIETIQEEVFLGCIELEKILNYNKINELGKKTFYGCTKLEQDLVFESQVNIGEEAFSLSAIKSIQLKKEGSFIGKAAFRKCERLTNIKLKDTEETANTWPNWKEGLNSSVIIEYNV